MTITPGPEPNLAKLSEENKENFSNKEKDENKKWVRIKLIKFQNFFILIRYLENFAGFAGLRLISRATRRETRKALGQSSIRNGRKGEYR